MKFHLYLAMTLLYLGCQGQGYLGYYAASIKLQFGQNPVVLWRRHSTAPWNLAVQKR